MGGVQVCVYVAFVVVAVVAARNHDQKSCPGPLMYYEDLGCSPVYKYGWDRCAIRYDCDHMNERSKNKCYINGHEYNLNEFLNQEDANACDRCICRSGYKDDEIAAFECKEARICLEVFARDGCYLRKDPSKCCRDPQEICPEKPEYRPICVVNGEEYKDGEPFEVDDDPELSCICQPGYQGKNVPPFCVRRSNRSTCAAHPAFSHIDDFGYKCAPVFFNDKLDPNRCYNIMKCQNSNDAVLPNHNDFNPYKIQNEQNMCLFGNLKIRIGDSLKPFARCITCICEVPPVLTCEFLLEKDTCDVRNSASYTVDHRKF